MKCSNTIICENTNNLHDKIIIAKTDITNYNVGCFTLGQLKKQTNKQTNKQKQPTKQKKTKQNKTKQNKKTSCSFSCR